MLLVNDMLKDAPGEAIRFALLSSHYRQPFDWTKRGIDDAVKTLTRFYEVIGASDSAGGVPDPGFIEAMCDDLNTPKAIAEMHAMAKAGRGADLKASGALLGFLQQDPSQWQAGLSKAGGIDAAVVEQLIAERNAARASKNWAESDRIRDLLTGMGVTIKDTPQGTEWRV